MIERLRIILQEACRLLPGQPVLVGVSGGPDSLCLLDALDRLGYLAVVAHFNHSLRPEAEREAQYVRRIAAERGLGFLLGEEDVSQYAQANHLSVEEAARMLRYKFLFDQALSVKAQAVAVGHHADDQVETVLMHLLRGSGLAGLKGMQARSLPNAWSQTTPLIRPLLEFWREEVQAYCAERNLHPVLDTSNQDLSYFRNRLRLELIPLLQDYNPAIRRILWQTAEALRGDFETVEDAVDESWRACVCGWGEGFIAFDLEELATQSAGIQRQLFRRAIASLRPEIRDIQFAAIDRALRFLSDPARPEQIELLGGLHLISEAGKLWIAAAEAELPSDEWPQLKDKKELCIQSPGTLELGAGWQLRIAVPRSAQAALRQAETNADPYQAWLALDLKRARVTLRTCRPGERFRPMGMVRGSLKISDFMINQKIPRRLRAAWPLVDIDGQVAWVAGHRIGQAFRLTPESRHVVHLCLAQASQD